jgi:signal transduction histidine kinase
MVTPAQAVLAVAVVAGAGLCALGVVSYRRQEPGSALFGAFLVGWGSLPLIDAAVAVLFEFGSISGLFWVAVVVPWFLFALRYTGRGVGRRILAGLTLPALGLVPWAVAVSAGGPVVPFEILGILIFVAYAALSVLGGVLVVRATRRYTHLSVAQGAWLAVAGVIPAAAMNSFGVLLDRAGLGVVFGVYAAGFVGVFVAAAVVLFRTEAFESTPAPGTVGRRAIANETDDLIAILDDDGRVVSRNEPMRDRLPEGDGGDVASVLGVGIEALRDRETVELQTDHGVRKFDPQVTTLSDQHDRHLGWMVSLRDVTERDIQRQRLEVLNRIVRHNLRNQASVIEANTEVVADAVEDEELASHLATAQESVAELLDLGAKAKTVEELLARDGAGREAVDVDPFLDSFARERDAQWPDADVTATDGADVTVECDPDVLEFVLDNLVENAVEHARPGPTVELSATADGDEQYPVTIAVEDDGPGIPDREIDVIEAGTETPLKHGSGIGLWVTNWVVQDVGGTLAFGEAEAGSVVSVKLPHRPLDAGHGQR